MAISDEDAVFGKQPVKPPAHVLGQNLDDLSAQPDADALATELADMLEVRRSEAPGGRTQLTINALKTPAQNARRRELFRLVSFAGLARALAGMRQRANRRPSRA